jgi:lysophospholipase L1-like esterase
MMPEPPKDTATNWFQRNPKKTLVAVTLIFLLAIVAGAEKFLEYNNRRQGIVLESEVERRYVRLKEFRPGTRLLLAMPRNHLPYTDNAFTKRYRYDIDANGFIVPSRKYNRPDKVIVFLGGSTTECMFVDQDHRFPYVVGEILERDTGAKVNSYNGGMSGSNSLNAIDVLINKVIPLKPDIVVFMENINDLSTLLYEGSYWSRGQKLFPDQAKMVHDFAADLQTIVCICKAWGIVPVLMTQANRVTDHPDPVVLAYITREGLKRGLSYQEFKTLYDAFNDTIREVGRKNQVMVIDLAREVPPDKKYLYDLVHFNDAGSQLAAQIIAGRLKGIIEAQRGGPQVSAP